MANVVVFVEQSSGSVKPASLEALGAARGIGDSVTAVLGGEGAGLPPALRRDADLAVRIPMAGRVESLSVAAAAAVLLFEAARQRRDARSQS